MNDNTLRGRNARSAGPGRRVLAIAATVTLSIGLWGCDSKGTPPAEGGGGGGSGEATAAGPEGGESAQGGEATEGSETAEGSEATEGSETAEGGQEGQVAQGERTHLTLKLWHSYRGDEEQAINQVLQRFNSTHPDTTLEALAIPFDAYPDRITAAIPRGRGPDLFIYAHDRVGDWADEGIIESVLYWVDDALLDQFFDETVQPLVYDRNLYGLPLAFKSVVLFYNPELVQTPPTTTDEMIELAQSLTDTSGSEARYGLVYQYNLLYFHAPWLHGFGGRVMDEAGNLTLDSPEAIASVAFAQSLYQQHHLLPENVYSQSVVSLFNAGRAAMVISGPWFIAEIAEGTPWAVAPLPIISATGQPAQPFLSSEAIMISAESENKERAFEVARWLATDLPSARTRMDVGHQPVALKAAYEDESRVDPVTRVFQEQMLNSVPMPNLPLMRQVWGHFDTALFNAVKNNADPGEVLRTARERIESE
jgi:maltose-binding protein MalE